MARYRIVQRPRCTQPSKPRYDVQKRNWPWGWELLDFFFTMEKAEEYIKILCREDINRVEWKVMKEID